MTDSTFDQGLADLIAERAWEIAAASPIPLYAADLLDLVRAEVEAALLPAAAEEPVYEPPQEDDDAANRLRVFPPAPSDAVYDPPEGDAA